MVPGGLRPQRAARGLTANRTAWSSVGSAQQNQLSVRCGRPVVTDETSTGGAPTATRTRGVELDVVTPGLDERRELALERVDRRVGVLPRGGRTLVVPRADERREVRVGEEQRPSGRSSRIVYCTGSTLPTRSCSCTNSRSAITSSSVVHGVNGSHDGRTSMPVRAQELDRARRVGGGVALVEQLERRVVHRLERGHDEEAPGGGELRPHVGVAEHVLDLDGAVERDVGKPLVQARTIRRECGGRR